jgi:hypothetical protein
MAASDDDGDGEWPLNDENRSFLESLLTDPQSLHRQLCIGVADKVPNLREGGLESFSLIELAHLIHPYVCCPTCGVSGNEGSHSPNFTPSLVIRTVSKQNSYLCANCWGHNSIPIFGIYGSEGLE